jgi:hypothetical protein
MEKQKHPEIIDWEASEYPHHEKGISWHISYIVISAALVVYAAYSKSIITTIAFVLLAIVGWIFANRQPERVRYQLNSNGVVMGSLLIPYKNIKNFWIIYNPPQVKTLNLETTALLNRLISIELENQDPVAVKNYLQNYLMEDLDREESLSDIITRKSKF